MKPKTLILRSAGTNADYELAHAFEIAGSDTQYLHVNDLIDQPDALNEFDMLGLPGGFSYGDDIAAGRILANRVRHRLMEPFRQFVLQGKPVIGICNGFQVLIKTGLLPAFDLNNEQNPPQLATLTNNTNPRFVDKWVGMQVDTNTKCIWTKGLEQFDLPIAHGEGRFVASNEVLDQLESQGQIALRYTNNPNGSAKNIAGICDPTGLVLGLMPHPERFTHPTHHPNWTRQQVPTSGLTMFENAVNHVKSNIVCS